MGNAEPGLSRLLTDAVAGQRISEAAAGRLWHQADLLALADAANRIRCRRHPDPVVTFVIDRNINYTNVCSSGCRFCAFYRPPDHPDAYVIDRDTLAAKVKETLALGGTQVLLQGGLHPDLPLDFYRRMLADIKACGPVHIHGFSPPEIAYLAELNQMPIRELIQLLMAAGLDSIPGGGAEILVDRVRRQVSPHKCDAETWLTVMRTAHLLGMRSTATMMFGHLEQPADVIAHLVRVRRLQDETGGFTAFIPVALSARPHRPGGDGRNGGRVPAGAGTGPGSCSTTWTTSRPRG
jgi:cyclic dehypoxanthinyl futalosine synthase